MKVPSPLPRFVVEEAPVELGFHFRDGSSARCLVGFADALARLSVEDVWFHREHFAAWLREVVQDDPLARRVEAYALDPPAAPVLREVLEGLVRRRVAILGDALAA